MKIVLYEPEIPPNTGNIARLCAATGTPLHLIEPLGFSLEDKYLKRAGLDYWPHVDVTVHPDLDHFLQSHEGGVVCSSARGGTLLHDFAFEPDDAILIGPETRGIPAEVLDRFTRHVRIPIRDAVRSLNQSTATGILLYQALGRTGLLPA